ncbi:MAG: 23S rRNA (uracil(1939)-C(5))-methyltransferase RlmD [Lachnospiraceae bacterium]|nr:23S rRNA (uracil(1939)-C(5))-methyltransferase RlmD [Lachnospiraceae bacterium]
MKKGDILTGTVESTDFPNKGTVSYVDEGSKEAYKFQVSGVIEGQKVKFRIHRKGKNGGTGKGTLIEVVEKSPFENCTEPCEMAGICGGCQYQTIEYHNQLKIKENQIKRLLSPVIGEETYDNIYEGIKDSPIREGYRNKMELSFGDSEKDGPLMLGLHRRGSFYDIVDASGCRIMNEDMRCAARITLEYFRGKGTPYLHKRTGEGYLRHLLLRRGEFTGELLIDLVTAPVASVKEENTAACTTMDKEYEKELLEGWKDAIISKLNVKGIIHTRCGRVADVIEDQGTDILYGSDHIKDVLLGLTFRITPFSFFQTNSSGAEVLYQTARDYISGGISGKTVFDLYSGTGTIAQIISPAAKNVIGVEIVEEAVEAAKENAAINGIYNCNFISGDVLKVIDEIEEKPDMIILDPPRDGIHPKALPKLIGYGVDEILYISCKPTSLARDLPAFMEAGYRPRRLCCVDMFPNTTGVESVVKLIRQ